MVYPANLLDVPSQLKGVSVGPLRRVLYLLTSLIILIPAWGQGTTTPQPGDRLLTDTLGALRPGGLLHPTVPGCIDALGNDLKGRACFFAADMTSPGSIAHALFSSSFSQWRNTPNIWHQDRDDAFKRFGFFYEQKAARDGGEFLAGYLHHENFRPEPSHKSGFVERSKAALLSVVRTRGEDDQPTFSLAPVAGALSAGFIGAADYRHRELLDAGLRHSAAIYGFQFGSALFREFKPDILTYSNKVFQHFR